MTDPIEALCEFAAADDPAHPERHAGEPCPFYVASMFLLTGEDVRAEVSLWRVDISPALKPNGSVPLSLNDRGMHWAAKAHAIDRVKSVVRNAVMAEAIPHVDHVHVEIHFRPKTNRFRDVDNIVATLKPAIDALHHRDTAENAPVPYEPIVDGDDPRYLTWAPPILHAPIKGEPAALWLILRSAG